MIEMPVRNQNRVCLRREMTHSISNSRNVRLNARASRNAQEIHPREVRIDKQRVAPEFELVTVCAEVGHAHSVARRICRRITHYQVGVGAESCAKGLGGEAEEKKESAVQALTAQSIKRARCGQLQVCLTNSAPLVNIKD